MVKHCHEILLFDDHNWSKVMNGDYSYNCQHIFVQAENFIEAKRIAQNHYPKMVVVCWDTNYYDNHSPDLTDD